MDSSLNRSMHSMWSTHRAKLNLNSPTPPLAPPNGTSHKPQPIPSSAEAPKGSGPDSESTAEQATSPPLPPSSSLPQPPISKRKAKPSTTSTENKRVKLQPNLVENGLQKYPPPAHTLASLGGLESAISTLVELAALPLLHPEIYVQTGVSPPRGVLLTGPPGCGKTALAGGLAGTLGLPFISVSAPSVVSGMSGESESKLRDLFEEAKKHSPSILFLDELDAIAPKRESAQREMEKRIVAQLLTCLDGSTVADVTNRTLITNLDLHWHKPPLDGSLFTPKPVIVLAATNRPDALDSALRRAGRFDNEVVLGVPDASARESILRALTSPLRLGLDVDLKEVAARTPGYVGADLAALVGKAGSRGVKRIWQTWGSHPTGTHALPDDNASQALPAKISDVPPELTDGDSGMAVDTPGTHFDPLPATASGLDLLPQMKPNDAGLPFLNPTTRMLLTDRTPLSEQMLSEMWISMQDFLQAIPDVQPSSTREGFTTVPSVKWEAVGGVKGVREDLTLSIIAPIRHPSLFAGVGIAGGGGVLLWGPPGCGKTLLARATAGECRANFVCVRGPEVVNKYVGESERALRQVFSRARSSAPCVIFFDEIDALVPRRDDQLSESSARIVNTFLTELDSLDPSTPSGETRSVYVIGATNRPDMIDPAMVRPGRLDKLLYVDLPNSDERVEIVKAVVRSRGVPLDTLDDMGNDMSTWSMVERLVREKCDGFSGADLASLVREAGVVALKRLLARLPTLSSEMGDSDEIPQKVVLSIADFAAALPRVSPSVSVAQRKKYEMLRNKFAGLPVRSGRKGEDEDKRVEQ